MKGFGIGVALWAVLALGNDPRVERKMKVDLEIAGKEKIQEVLKARLADKKGKKLLHDSKKDYQAAQKELEDLLAKNADPSEILAAEVQVEKARVIFVTNMVKYGPCFLRPIEVENRKGVPWYSSDGSCFFYNETAAQKESRFTKAKAFLTDMGKYSISKGGFHFVLEFLASDKTGKLDPALAKIKNKDLGYAYIAVGDSLAALHYFAKSSVAHDDKELKIGFEAVEPTTYALKNIQTYSKANPGKPIIVQRLGEVFGGWYVEKDSIRYFTEANLKPILDKYKAFMPALTASASRIHADTLARIVELTKPEEEKK